MKNSKHSKELRRRQKKKAAEKLSASRKRTQPVVRTPARITQEIVLFSESIVGPQPCLSYLTIQPDSNAHYHRCHQNVLERIARDGGSIQFGWAIWECKPWLEAEFHSVWACPTHGLVDLTPDKEGERRRLFLVDGSRKWDPDQKLAIPRKLQAKSNSDSIARFIAAKTKQERIRTSYPSAIPLSPEDQARCSRYERASLRAIRDYLAGK